MLRSLAKFIQDRSHDQPVTPVIQAAVDVLRSRNAANDDGALVDLTNADLSGINLEDAVLVNTDFDHAVLSDASLQGTNLNYAFSEMRTSLARTWLARTSPRPLSTRQRCAMDPRLQSRSADTTAAQTGDLFRPYGLKSPGPAARARRRAARGRASGDGDRADAADRDRPDRGGNPVQQRPFALL